MSEDNEDEENDFIVDNDGGGYKEELVHDSQFKAYNDKQRQKYASYKPASST